MRAVEDGHDVGGHLDGRFVFPVHEQPRLSRPPEQPSLSELPSHLHKGTTQHSSEEAVTILPVLVHLDSPN